MNILNPNYLCIRLHSLGEIYLSPKSDGDFVTVAVPLPAAYRFRTEAATYGVVGGTRTAKANAYQGYQGRGICV